MHLYRNLIVPSNGYCSETVQTWISKYIGLLTILRVVKTLSQGTMWWSSWFRTNHKMHLWKAITFLCNLHSFGLEVLSWCFWSFVIVYCGNIMWRGFVIMWRDLLVTYYVSIMMSWASLLTCCVFIYVIHRPGGPYWEKLCPRSRVRPEAAGRGPFSRQRTDQGRWITF